jgi:hypothetical protein
MGQLQAQAEREIAGNADDVYRLIADYAGRHRALMPAAYHDYAVEKDDAGTATVVRWTLHVGNHRRPYAMGITYRPEETTIIERDQQSSFTTEWRANAAGTGCRVRLTSTWQQRSRGFPALFERLFAPRSLARLHTETLQRLGAEATA